MKVKYIGSYKQRMISPFYHGDVVPGDVFGEGDLPEFPDAIYEEEFKGNEQWEAVESPVVKKKKSDSKEEVVDNG